ncbi:mannosyltransferase family protein [Maioricimonas rarisocia]|nr:mannosyltransferase family protein [Maioricimonas rarisocia]
MSYSGAQHFLERFARWDARHYVLFVEEGYGSDPEPATRVVFFPAVPLLARGIVALTGLSPIASLLVVSHASLLAASLLLFALLRRRDPPLDQRTATLCVLCLLLLPTGVFFRVAYTESMFLLLTVLAMYGMAAHWRPVLVAVVIGLSTATRPTGVALLLPFAWYLWQRERNPPSPQPLAPSLLRVSPRGLLLLPVACWGLLAYMTWLWWRFDDPVAFVTQMPRWVLRGDATLWERLWTAVTLSPLREAYDPTSDAYWAVLDKTTHSVLSLRMADPLWFAGTALLIVVGAKQRWLSTGELLLAAGLLGIPWFLHSHASMMQSYGRYAAVVWPACLVAGQMLARIPRVLTDVLCGTAALLLVIYAAMFSARYFIV